MSEWFRVTDVLSPLCGCDVRGSDAVDENGDTLGYLVIEALRRVDIFQGDRPHQRVAAPGENLGLLIDVDQLERSPIQDDIVELVTDRPHGPCLDEYELDRSDGSRLRVVIFENAIQAALDEPEHVYFGTTTFWGVDYEARFRKFEEAFISGADFESLSVSAATNGGV